jgi:energy-coupling factor transporter ATP-binding protein EcfA2
MATRPTRAPQYLDIRGRAVRILGGAPDSTRILKDTFWPAGVLDVVESDPVGAPDIILEEAVEDAATIRGMVADFSRAATAGVFEITRGDFRPRHDSPAATLFVLEDGDDVAALVSTADTRTLLRTETPSGARWLARIVRDMATRFASADGALILHSSAFTVSGRTYLVIGDSGAGKSTTAIALARLLPDATWLGNDRIHVDTLGADLRVTACPLPLAVNRSSLDVMGVTDFGSWDLHAGHPDPDSDWDQFMGEDKMKLSHGEVERLLGVRVAANGVLHGVIFPRVVPGQPFEVADADPTHVSAVLARNCFSLDDNLYGEEWLRVNDSGTVPESGLGLEEFERRLGSMTVLRCTLFGPDDVARLGEHLLSQC